MNEPNPRLLALLGTRQSENFFFDAVRFKRNQILTEKKVTWNWAEKDHKLYPSAIKSWTMCPHRYVHVDVHKPPSFTTEALYKMEVGTYLHRMYQECAVDIKALLWEAPDFSRVMFAAGGGNAEEFRQKYLDIFPEVPIYDLETGVSGRADAVLNIYGKPVVFDIKTTSVEDVKFDEKLGAWESGRWAKYIKALPSTEHQIQVSVYCYFMNKFKYYTQPIRKAGLGYVNLLMKAGEPNAEHEVYFDFTEEMEERIGLLLKHLGHERKAYLEGRESQCEYIPCRAHSLMRKIKEE